MIPSPAPGHDTSQIPHGGEREGALLLTTNASGTFQRSQKTSGFNVYHPKVQCHGNPGTPDSLTRGRGGQRANIPPQLPTSPAGVGAGLQRACDRWTRKA